MIWPWKLTSKLWVILLIDDLVMKNSINRNENASVVSSVVELCETEQLKPKVSKETEYFLHLSFILLKKQLFSNINTSYYNP